MARQVKFGDDEGSCKGCRVSGLQSMDLDNKLCEDVCHGTDCMFRYLLAR